MPYNADILYQKVREIRAQRIGSLDKRTTDQVETEYYKECMFNSLIRRGSECGQKCHSRSRSHYGKAPRGISGHRYPSSSERPQVVKNADGKNVVIA